MSSSKTGEATPRPWELGGLDHVASIYSEVDLRTVADRLTVADARLIVESVNPFDALQAQNKLLREACLAASRHIETDPVIDDNGLEIFSPTPSSPERR